MTSKFRAIKSTVYQTPERDNLISTSLIYFFGYTATLLFCFFGTEILALGGVKFRDRENVISFFRY